MSMNTRWVVNIRVWDDDVKGGIRTIHVLNDTEADALDVIKMVTDQSGPPAEPEDLKLTEVPLTWECHGEDGCMVQ